MTMMMMMMKADSVQKEMEERNLRPRLCYLTKGERGYGFHLHGERSSGAQFIRRIEAGSPAELAGLRSGDRVVEVNGENVEKDSHQQVVQKIMEVENRTRLLVVDRETDEFLLLHSLPCTEDLAVEMSCLLSPRTSSSSLASATLSFSSLSRESLTPSPQDSIILSPRDFTHSLSDSITPSLLPKSTTSSPPDSIAPLPGDSIIPSPQNSTPLSPGKSVTPSPEDSITQSSRNSINQSPCDSVTPSLSNSVNQSPYDSITQSPSKSITQSPSNSITQSPSNSITQSPSNSITQSPSNSITQSPSKSNTQSPSKSITQSPYDSITQSPSNSNTQSPSKSITQSPSNSITQSQSNSITQSPSKSITQSPSNSITQSQSNSITQSPSNSITQSPSKSITQSPYDSITQSPSNSNTQSPSKSITQSPSNSNTQSPYDSITQSPSKSNTQSPSKSNTQSPYDSIIQLPSNSMTQSPSNSITTSFIREKSDETNVKDIIVTTDNKEMSGTEDMKARDLRPRLCHIVKDKQGFGFNLHCDKRRVGQFIRSVDPDSPAQRAGLQPGDRLIQVNGRSIEGLRHSEVVEIIRSGRGQTKLLVVDPETDALFQKLGITPTTAHLNEDCVDGPLIESPTSTCPITDSSGSPSKTPNGSLNQLPITNLTVTDPPTRNGSLKHQSRGSSSSSRSITSEMSVELSSSDTSNKVLESEQRKCNSAPGVQEGKAVKDLDPLWASGLHLSPTAAEARQKVRLKKANKRAPPMAWNKKYEIFSNF
ncbi:uro-adherence factor A [Pangasianodon hypophthalmus]|uniref:uro-adherence factor A n=1 Tax=Pangasianodon hypophthalmus TaxID=310915 RepID=UPI0023082B19|nr:uro-adherence factor A [Pangasianodon hypophthalmus]XP_053086065.1 uro-adherence factor A [Pangasianodon hypophthalmus]